MQLGTAYLAYLIIGIFAIILIIITTLLVILRVIRGSKNKLFIALVMFFVFLSVWAIASSIFPIFNFETASKIAITVPISAYLGFYSLYLFTESVIFVRINIFRSTFFACVITATSTLMIADPTYLNLTYIVDFGYYVAPSILFSIMQLIILAGVGAVFMVMARF